MARRLGDNIRSSFLEKMQNFNYTLHCKKSFAVFPSPAGMSLTKLLLARIN
jgi:hypothetical protein